MVPLRLVLRHLCICWHELKCVIFMGRGVVVYLPNQPSWSLKSRHIFIYRTNTLLKPPSCLLSPAGQATHSAKRSPTHCVHAHQPDHGNRTHAPYSRKCYRRDLLLNSLSLSYTCMFPVWLHDVMLSSIQSYVLWQGFPADLANQIQLFVLQNKRVCTTI